MLQIRPGEQFPISRQLADPLDTATYFVRAVARWADSDVIVPINGANFLNLTSYGSQRFKGNMHVPADKNGGLGSYLAITTTVYEDSGYTTVSSTYSIEEVVYLVMDRRNPFQGAGGGGVTVDYKKIRQIVKEEQPAPMGMPEFDLQPTLEAIASVKDLVASIKFPEPGKVDLKPILDRISQAERALHVTIKRIPQPDFSPIVKELQEQRSVIDAGEYAAKMEALFDRIKQFLGNDLDEINEKFSKIEGFLNNLDYVNLKKVGKIEDHQNAPNDEDELSS